jgi:hypothetical protein
MRYHLIDINLVIIQFHYITKAITIQVQFDGDSCYPLDRCSPAHALDP